MKSALQQRAALARGTQTAEALMAETYDALERANGAIGAVVSALPRDAALALARAADTVPQESRGPLHGLPLAVKDLANAEGFPTSMGSPLLAGTRPKTDDIHIARLRRAGAVVFGKTNTPEFGLGSHSTNPVFGVTRNPYDVARSAGGSSGGAGAALAAGIMSIADGSDMMGSLRNPAAWNGVYGLRPTVGNVPSEPQGETYTNLLATNGPMARTPEDLAVLLDVMSGPDLRQFHRRPVQPVSEALSRKTGALKLGWLGDWGGAWAMETGLLAAHEGALACFEAAGHGIERLDAPFDRDRMWTAWITLRSFAVAGSLRPLSDQRDGLNAQAQWELDRGLAMTAPEIMDASATRSAWLARAMALFDTYDALIAPVAQVRPFPAEWAWPKEIAGQSMDTYHRWMEAVVPASLIGLPALALPAMEEASGLPFGLQIIGPPDSDARLLQIARDWHALGACPAPKGVAP